MLETIFKKIKDSQITISDWVIGFVCILFIRFILEALSSPTSSGIISSDPYTLIHYGLFFLGIVLSTLCVVGYITKDYVGFSKIILFGLPIIWIAPLIDIILSFGKGFKMTYIFDTHNKLLFDFFTFFGPTLTRGATYGIRIEILLILFGIGTYVWITQKSIAKTIVAVCVSYILGFIFASIPGILYTLTHGSAGNTTEVLYYLEHIITNSNIFHNTLHDDPSSVSQIRFFELIFNKFLSQILFIISCLCAAFIFWNIHSKKFVVVLKNIRIERINFYIISLLCGMGFAYINNMGTPFVVIDLLGISCLIISWATLWLHAVHLNDIYDVEIDEISNKERPLVKQELSVEEMKETGKLFLVIALLGSWCAGFYPFFGCLVYITASYIYSVPPLRLRRFPIIPSFLISIVCLATILTGFFFVSMHKELQAFPSTIAIGIIIIVTLAINFKDLKDVEGDTANGIMTLATMFPKKNSEIIGVLLALSILLTPFVLSFYFLYIFAVPASIIGYKIVTAKPYNEKRIFTLRFVFITCIAVSYVVVYWAAHLYNLI